MDMLHRDIVLMFRNEDEYKRAVATMADQLAEDIDSWVLEEATREANNSRNDDSEL